MTHKPVTLYNAFNLGIVVGSNGAAVANAAVVGIGPLLLLSFLLLRSSLRWQRWWWWWWWRRAADDFCQCVFDGWIRGCNDHHHHHHHHNDYYFYCCYHRCCLHLLLKSCSTPPSFSEQPKPNYPEAYSVS